MDCTGIIKKMYQDFASGNMQAVLSVFDKEIKWIRPGEPAIPFAGVFNGMEGLAKMFSLVAQSVKITSFTPKKFISNDDTVVVIGEDHANVISTGKSYNSEWVYVYTLKDNKIIHVQVYIDTLELAEAFQP